jgi:nucleotide sugar dehydrogenase
MPNLLNLTPLDVDTPQKRANYRVSIIGCGEKGIFYANTFASSGYQVVCTDADPSVTKKVTKGKTSSSEPQTDAKLKKYLTAGQISVSSDRKKAVAQSDIVVIAVSAKVDDQKKIDTTQVVSACKQVGTTLQRGTLVIYCGVAGLGFTGSIVKETLENTSGLKVGADFGLAYNPVLLMNARRESIELNVAATDPTSLQATVTILKTLTKNVTQICDLTTAEIATLFAIVKRDVNRALANELAVFCERASLDYFEVAKLLGLNAWGFLPSITETEGQDEPYLLLDVAENLNVKLRLPTLARQINEDMVKHVVNLVQEALRSCEKTLRRAKVAVLGPAGQVGLDLLVKMLMAKGAKVNVYDPTAKKQAPDAAAKTSLNDAVEGADCLIVLSGQEQFNRFNLKKIRALMKSPAVIVDLVDKFDPREVETEGFIYRGLGNGTR